MSMRIASRLRAVSTSVSPFDTLDPDAATLTVSAESRFSANSNEMRVRVDASKNRLTIVEPRSVGTFLIARSLISLNGSAVSRISSNLLAGQRLERRADLCRATASRRVLARSGDDDGVAAVEILDEHVDAVRRRDVDLLADDVRRGSGSSRPPRSIEHGERDARRPAEVGELVERRANRAAGVQHVVDDDDVLAVDVHGSCVGPTTGRGPTVCRSSR